MSAFGIVKDLTESLITGLNDAFKAQPEINFPQAPPHVATSEGPATMLAAGPPKQGVSIWPYRFTRDEFVSNEGPRAIGTSILQIPPLKVDIWYLCTPLTTNFDYNQLLMEKIHQYMYDLGIFTLLNDTISVTFETPGNDELYQLWSALETPYVLSSIFVARYLEIDSARSQLPAQRVIERYDRFEPVVQP